MSRPKTYLTRERGQFLDFAAGQLRKLYGIETVDTATIAVTIHDMLAAVREQQYTPACGECDRNQCQHAPQDAEITQPATLAGMGPGEPPLAYQPAVGDRVRGLANEWYAPVGIEGTVVYVIPEFIRVELPDGDDGGTYTWNYPTGTVEVVA